MYVVSIETRKANEGNMMTEYEDSDWNNGINEIEKTEMFTIEKCDDPSELAMVNSRIDYQHRGSDLAYLCLYDYISLIYKRRRNAREMDVIIDTSEEKQKVRQYSSNMTCR